MDSKMNYTLLKELMKQSETECGFDPNKFAELIVRECAELMPQDNLYKMVLKHFGVE
jgi:hypothetical protein